MLEETFRKLREFQAGEGMECFDEAEIAALGAALRRLLYAPAVLRQRLQQAGASLVPSDFYSEIPTIEEITRSFAAPSAAFDRIFDPKRMAVFLAAMTPFATEFDPPLDAPDSTYSWNAAHTRFSYSDAMAYYALIRLRRPAVVLEVGSGWSTHVAAAACARNGSGRIICIEPYPPAFLAGIPRVEVLRRPVQEFDVDFFNRTLADNDVLFIDSTHTVKHGSDCIHLYLQILPGLERDVFVHAHDIFLPATLPQPMLRDEQIYWTEQYLLYAYLLENPRTHVLFGSEWHHRNNLAALTRFMNGRFAPGGGSLWFSQARRRD